MSQKTQHGQPHPPQNTQLNTQQIPAMQSDLNPARGEETPDKLLNKLTNRLQNNQNLPTMQHTAPKPSITQL